MFNNTSVISLTSVDTFAGMSMLEIKRLNYPRWAHTIAGIVLFITGTFGLLENILVLYTFARSMHLRSATNIYVISVVICDLCMAVLGVPLAWYNAFQGGWVVGMHLCIYEAFITYSFGLSSLYLLCAVSVNRYIVMVKPRKAPTITKRVAVLSCVSCVVVGFAWSIMPFLGWSSYGLEAHGITCGLRYDDKSLSNSTYILAICVFCFLGPLGIMTFSYYNVYITLRNANRNSVWNIMSRAARKSLKREKRVLRGCLFMCVAFFTCWSPYAIVSFWQTFGDADAIPLVLTEIPVIMAKSQMVLNPVIYVATNKQFRQAFFAILPCTRPREPPVMRGEDRHQSIKTGGADGRMEDQAPTSIRPNDIDSSVTATYDVTVTYHPEVGVLIPLTTYVNGQWHAGDEGAEQAPVD